MKRGILGGSFNPIHIGHLVIAEDVREALGLDEIVLVPAGRPWMKDAAELAAARDRLTMVRRAVRGNARLTVSRVDLDRPGPSYATDTVRDVRRTGRGEDEYFFIIGMDALEALPEWRKVGDLISLCQIAVVERPGHEKSAAMRRVADELPRAAESIQFVPAARIDVSSTDIRRRVREGRSIKYRVPAAVEEYIARRGLYR